MGWITRVPFRLHILFLCCALIAIQGSAVGPARGQSTDDVLISPNLSLVTAIPLPGVIGARFRDDVMFVTSVMGLTTYDVSDPANPTQLDPGRLALPHFENEDVDLGGGILLISNDAAESTGILYVIDISNPAAPALLSTFQLGGNPVEGGPGHTASCILDCRYAWITDAAGIRVVDLTDPAAPVEIGTFETPAGGGVATHDVQVDRDGLAWVVGFGGTVAYRLPGNYSGNGLGKIVTKTGKEGFSTYFEEFGIGDGGNPNDFIHHNSAHPRGKLVLVTEEDYTRPTCQGAGSFQSWKVEGSKLLPLDQWETEVLAENPQSTTAAVCSAHYFDVKRNVVAQGWYEQGLRVLDISSPKAIRQIGFFVPPNAMTWAAYFPPTDPKGKLIYVLDASHGLDVLEFDRPARGRLSLPKEPCRSENDCKRQRPTKVTAPILDAWMTTGPTVGTPNGDFGYACRIAI